MAGGKITPAHRQRHALPCICESTLSRVESHRESTRRQQAFALLRVYDDTFMRCGNGLAENPARPLKANRRTESSTAMTINPLVA